jgi:hypothetical protein
MLQEFKEYVDAIILSPADMTLDEAQTHYGYTPNGTITFYNHLSQLIRDQIETDSIDNIIRKSKFSDLREDLINRYVLANENPVEYFRVLSVIRSSCNTADTNLVPMHERTKWEKAIEIAKRYNQVFSTYNEDLSRLQRSYGEEFDRANSIKAMRDYGCEVNITNEDIEISCDKVFADIDKAIKRIGGFTVADFLLKILERFGKYLARFDRFLIHRETNSLTQSSPQIPFGYLLNLCAKYPHSDIPVSEEEIKQVIRLAITACNAAYPVQHYNIWYYLNNSSETAIEMLTEVALWDSIFSIPQAKSDYQIAFLEFLFSQIDPQVFADTFSYDSSIYISVAKEIFKHRPKNRPFRFKLQEINDWTKIPTNTLRAVLDLMCHKKLPNNSYLAPGDVLSTDYFLKPLIKLNDQYIILWRSWNALSLFEVFADGLRGKMKAFESFVGGVLEKYVQKRLSEKNITHVFGKYKVKGTNGEADIVIETSKKIVLIEIKKKVLTRKTKSGSDVGLIIDLSESIVDATLQSGKTELLLREHGSLELKSDDGKKIIIELKGRSFEHVSLTHMEFGGLHDKKLMQNLYFALLKYQYQVIDKTDLISVDKFNALAKKQEELVEQYNALMEKDAMPKNNPYLDNWFISFNQLMEVINLSSDNESFYQNLITHKFIATGTFDFYNEFEQAKLLSESEQTAKLQEVLENSNVTYVPLRGGPDS